MQCATYYTRYVTQYRTIMISSPDSLNSCYNIYYSLAVDVVSNKSFKFSPHKHFEFRTHSFSVRGSACKMRKLSHSAWRICLFKHIHTHRLNGVIITNSLSQAVHLNSAVLASHVLKYMANVARIIAFAFGYLLLTLILVEMQLAWLTLILGRLHVDEWESNGGFLNGFVCL